MELGRFARSAAASFLVETSTAEGTSTFRLSHQALNDALLREHGTGRMRFAEQRLTRAFIEPGRGRGGGRRPPTCCVHWSPTPTGRA